MRSNMFTLLTFLSIALIQSINAVNELCEFGTKWSVIKGPWNVGANCEISVSDDATGNVAWLGSSDGLTPDANYVDTDFTLEGELSVSSLGDSGFLFRAQTVEPPNYTGENYYVGIGLSRLTVGFMDGGNWGNVRAESRSYSAGRHTLKIVVTGTTCDVYVDGVLEYNDVVIDQYLTGGIGLRTMQQLTTYYSLTYTPMTFCSPTSCEDNNACTDDRCDEANRQCINAPKSCANGLVCVNGNCQRDCSSLAIDDFLLQCSSEFGETESDIAAIKTRLDGVDSSIAALETSTGDHESSTTSSFTEVNTKITAIEGRLDGIDAEIANIKSSSASDKTATDQTVSSLQGQINAINDYIDSLKKLGAQSAFGSFINEKGVFSNGTEDLLLVVLMMSSMVTIIALICFCVHIQRSKTQIRYGKVYQTDVDTDVVALNQ